MRLMAALFSTKGLFVLLFSAVLTACTVVVDEPPPGPGPRPPGPPQYCTREYAPVCARRGGDRQTFSNACMAEQSGYRVVRDGPCRDYGGGGGGQTFCTQEYRPVCARRGGTLRTFSNACEARAADYQVIDNGPC